jgi:hypothetical protein
MKSALAQPIVVVENVTGAAGSIGVGRLARGTRRLYDRDPDNHSVAEGLRLKSNVGIESALPR